MRTFGIAALLLVGVLLGVAVDSFRVSRTGAEQTLELSALRAILDQAQKREKEAAQERDQLQAEADRLRQWSAEVHRLRAEVSRLTREAAQVQTARDQTTLRDVRKPGSAPEPSSSKVAVRAIATAMENAPVPVQATVLREFGHPPPRGVLNSVVDKEGKASYVFKGQSDNGSPLFVRMDEAGSVLEKSVAIPTENIPVQVQDPVAQILGDTAINGAREIRTGTEVRYELTAKSPEAGIQVAVRGDGTVISYSAQFQNKDKDQRKPSAKEQPGPPGPK